MSKKSRKNSPRAAHQAEILQSPSVVESFEASQKTTDHLIRAIPIALGAVIFLVYLLTVYPESPGGDSGELIAAAKNLGVIHPPGYPLFTLLGKIFTFIPFGSVAWRVNLLSALCDTGAAALLYFSVYRWTRSASAGLLAGGLFAFSPRIWDYAVAAEVFPLNNLFAAALLLLAVTHASKPTTQKLGAFAFLFGLGLSNHHTLLFVGAPLGLWMIYELRGLHSPFSLLARCAGFGLLGLTPYVYLPLASSKIPYISWGDQTTWDGFLTHFFRREYGTLKLGAMSSEGELWKGVTKYLADLPFQTLGLGALAAISGAVLSVRPSAAFTARGGREVSHPLSGETDARRRLGWTLLFSFASYLIIFHELANLPIDEAFFLDIHARFWQLPNLFVFFWIGVSLPALASVLSRNRPRTPERPAERAVERALLAVACGAVALQLGVHFKKQDQHWNTTFSQLGRALLSALPPNAILLTQGDIYTNSTRYVQVAEGFRTDVKVIDRQIFTYPWIKRIVERHYPSVRMPGRFYRPTNPDGFTIRAFFDANAGSPIFLSNFSLGEDPSWSQGYTTFPYSLVNWVVPLGSPFDLKDYLARTDHALDSFTPPDPSRFRVGSWEEYIWKESFEVDHRRAKRLLTLALERGNDPAINRIAATLIDGVVKRHPAPTPEMYRNLGIAWSRLLQTDPTAAQQMVAAWTEYLKRAPTGDAEIGEIRRAVDAYSSKKNS